MFFNVFFEEAVMLLRLARALWGDLTKEEMKKFLILGVTMMFVIGVYWMLRVTKDGLFMDLVGYKKWQPVAKWVSILVMIVAVLGYSKLLDIFNRSRLIYMFCTFYGLSFILLSYLTAHPELIAVSPTSVLYPFVSWIPARVPGGGIGWVAYVLLESYGSLVIALFYSFIASVMTAGSAKKGYGMLMAITQLGTLSGVLFSMFMVERLGVNMLYAIGGSIIIFVPFLITYFIKCFPQDVAKQQVGGGKKKTGFFEGLRLILTRPYIMGVFVVVTFYEIMSTIVEYQMGWLASGFYTKEQFTVFKTYQGLGINIVALAFALLGTSYFMRKYGLKFCLMAFPAAVGTVLLANYFAFMGGVSHWTLMWVLMCASITIKGLNYALNKPTSEVMYIPTSKDVKFKSKGWIDLFGNRSTKGMGAAVSKSFGYALPALMLYGTVISLVLLVAWIFVGRSVGDGFEKLQAENKIVE